MKYKGSWEELVYDALDDFEHANPMEDIEVEASDLEEAERLITQEARVVIKLRRPDQSHGTFMVSILSITDETGHSVDINKPRES